MASFVNLKPLETTNTDLAAALSAVGIPLKKQCPVRILTGDRDQHCFFFEAQSPCGNYVTAELMLAWNDREWHLRNPEHPFAYLKVAFENRARLRDYVKGGEKIAVVTRGSKFGFISLNATPKVEREFFKELKR